MYAASTSSTTSGSGAARGTGGAERRIRVVRLLRPRRTSPAFGFSLRGGKEHATGFFISKVELNSEAYNQGLKMGDQVVSVNGHRVDDAVHAELAHYLSSQSRLKIKVRNVGMIPMKDKGHEPVSWQFVADHTSMGSETSSSPTLCHDTQIHQELRLTILVPPRAKLGCGICKGPDWKPGIFVQFVRENGIAREAGLRPGDQILACNGREFANISFNDAISAMKATGRLELLIREGVGTELVSPESSGYNSSASSAAGERSPAPHPAVTTVLAPPAALRRRLASVAEEAADRVDRLNMNRLKRRTWDSLDFEWKNIHNFDTPSDIEPDYDSPSIPNNPHTFDNQMKEIQKREYITNPSNRTIINLTENGATIQCSYEDRSPHRKAMYSTSQCQGNREDKKTIVVEVHHTSRGTNGSTHCNKHSSKTKELSDSSSVSSSTTLSSAIAEEILKRKMKKKENNSVPEPGPDLLKKSVVTNVVENEKKKQHDALMDEFKKVHRRMFANQECADDNQNEDGIFAADDIDRQQTLQLRKPVINETATSDKKDVVKNPPPPPPMPFANGNVSANENGSMKPIINGSKNVTDVNDNIKQNGTIKRIPTPDYNKNTKPVTTSIFNNKKPTEGAAEVESIESYKLKNPISTQPKAPSTYFMRSSNGPVPPNKVTRPVSVTIGEYSNGGDKRKEPSKLEFLGTDKLKSNDVTDNVPISNRLQSELALTLSRSNLRKKTDSIIDAGR